MKIREVFTIALVVFAGYSVVKDLFFNKKQCYYEETLENGNVLGSWSADNCDVRIQAEKLSVESDNTYNTNTKETQYSIGTSFFSYQSYSI